MELNNKELQPYRIWFEYLQTALNDKGLSKKIDRNYYKQWHLELIKEQTFNQWIKEHEKLFIDKPPQIKLYKGKRTPNTLLVEIPIALNVQEIIKEIGQAVKGLVAKPEVNQTYKIVISRPLQTMPLDHFHWAWQFKQKDKHTLDEIWSLVDDKQRERQKKVRKRVEQYKLTGKGIRQRNVSASNTPKVQKNKSILISRNIKKAQKILDNVCKGIFPGHYADH